MSQLDYVNCEICGDQVLHRDKSLAFYDSAGHVFPDFLDTINKYPELSIVHKACLQRQKGLLNRVYDLEVLARGLDRRTTQLEARHEEDDAAMEAATETQEV